MNTGLSVESANDESAVKIALNRMAAGPFGTRNPDRRRLEPHDECSAMSYPFEEYGVGVWIF
jgi:hypothetical protein